MDKQQIIKCMLMIYQITPLNYKEIQRLKRVAVLNCIDIDYDKLKAGFYDSF